MADISKLYGVTTALATPLAADGRFDEPSMRRLVRFVLDSGVNVLFALGAAGEFAALDIATRRRVVEVVKEAAPEGVPLIAGVTDNSTALVLRHIADAKDRGADFVLCTPPSFYRLSQDEVKDFYLRLAEEADAPVIAYNCPLSTNHLEPQTIAALADHPMMAGLKQTSTQIELEKIMLALGDREDFVLLSGREYLFLPALALGLRAFIMGGPGNVAPRWCKEILGHFRRGDLDQARETFVRMLALLERLYGVGTCAMAAVKTGMEVLGICERHMAHPVRATSPAQKQVIAGLFSEFGLV